MVKESLPSAFAGQTLLPRVPIPVGIVPMNKVRRQTYPEFRAAWPYSHANDMKSPEHFEVMPGYCRCRLSGHGSLEDAASRVIETIRFSREQGMEKLLVDATNWTGHESPTITDRFYIGSDFAKATGPSLKFALVVPPEIMHPRKFGITVIINRWTDANVFDSEKEALAWLLSE